ncbi:MAG: 50S ribosomal protein L10 [Candidatus Levybacteria bacterium]|nr:50S ribosomal protein L10 [Candidatus Levybacteria bacterium]
MATKQAKKSITKITKAKVVAHLFEKVKKSTAMILTNYQGMTHIQIEDLKRILKKFDSDLTITKNTLLLRALKESKIDAPVEMFNQPTATIFTYNEPSTALKELSKFIKILKMPIIKFGVFDGKFLSGNEVVRLAMLPSREVLLSQLVGGLKSPIYGLHRALNWNLQKFVMTLKAIEAKKV